jgi:hypothetical protein
LPIPINGAQTFVATSVTWKGCLVVAARKSPIDILSAYLGRNTGCIRNPEYGQLLSLWVVDQPLVRHWTAERGSSVGKAPGRRVLSGKGLQRRHQPGRQAGAPEVFAYDIYYEFPRRIWNFHAKIRVTQKPLHAR